MKTTLGSVLFRDYEPPRDGFAITKLSGVDAVFIGKENLGELGGCDTLGSLFGSTRNVYDLHCTAGGFLGRFRGKHVGELLHRRTRPRRICVDTAVSSMERRRWYCAQRLVP
jgi:hypothetical protein